MKKILLILLAVVFIISMLFMGIGCKPEAEEIVDELIEESKEEAGKEATEKEASEKTEETASAGEEVSVIDEIVIGIDQPNDTNNVFMSHGVGPLYMKQLIFNGLVELSQNFEILPSIAEDWEISEDGMQYTFYLRKDVKFHNGRELIAEDVKFTFDLYRNPENAYVWASNVKMIEEVEIIDDYTIIFTLDKPYSPFLAGIASGWVAILCEDSVREDEEGVLVADTLIGTGPYKYVEWVPEEQLTIEAFDDYWAGVPNVKRIVYKPIVEAATRLSALQAGDIDIIYSPPTIDLKRYLAGDLKSDEYVLATIAGTERIEQKLTFNHKMDGPIKENLALRKAIQYAIDVEAVMMSVISGTGSNDNGAWPAGNVWASDIPFIERDIEKSKMYLEEAGYPDGIDLVLCTTNFKDRSKIAEVIQAQLSEVGIHVTVNVYEIAKYYEYEVSNEGWDLKISGASIFIDPGQFWNLVLRTGGTANWWLGTFNRPEINDLLDQGEKTTDIAERKAIYNEIYQIIMDEVGTVWLYNEPVTYGARSELKGVEFSGRGDLIFSNNQGIPWITKVE